MSVSARWKPYVYGALSGVLLTISAGITGQFFGTSTTFPRFATLILDTVGIDLSDLLFYQVRDGRLTFESFPNWQLLFVTGIGLGAFISSRITGTFKKEKLPGMWVERFGWSTRKRIAYSLVGGAVAMTGARIAGGCPSGHGVSGLSQLGMGSLIALVMFFVGGVVTARILYKGGAA
jgi:uncharacterized protein